MRPVVEPQGQIDRTERFGRERSSAADRAIRALPPIELGAGLSKALVLLWLGAESARALLEPDLEAWERAHWVRFEPPVADAPQGLRYDDQAATRAEQLMEQARLSVGSLDEAGAEEHLAELSSLLREHVELPQAAWLTAEALHVEASLRARSDPVRAAQLVAQARALEGTRAPAFGAKPDEAPAEKTVGIALGGLGVSDRIDWDGVEIRRTFETPPGRHHVRVIRRERAVWAGWVVVEGTTGDLELPVPAPAACSLDDLEGTRIRAGRAMAPASVRCVEWAVARPVEHGVEVATCRGSSCGAFTRWTRRHGEIYAGPPQPPPEPGFPAWAGWTLAGIGAAAVAGVVLWQAGAFEGPEPGRTRWTFTGPSR